MTSPPLGLSLLRPTRTRTRLWQGGVAMSIIVLTFAVGNHFIAPAKAVNGDMLGLDFLPFYASGTFVRQGHANQLYDLTAIGAFEQATAQANGIALDRDVIGPFWNPPFYAWVFAPLSALPYRQALLLWTLLNVGALALSLWLLVRMLPANCSWRSWALVPLLTLVSMPFIQAISHGQNTFGSLLILTAAVTAWRARRAVLAGACCGLLFYKPQLAAVLAVAMTLSLGRRTLLGLACVGGLLLVISGLTLPGATGEWLHRLPVNLHAMQVERTYLWERHATFKAMLRMGLQGRGPGEAQPLVLILTAAASALMGTALLMSFVRTPQRVDDVWTGETNAVTRDRQIAATVAVTPLLMPFYFDYDLLLLAVPAVLFAGEMLAQAPGQPRRVWDRRLIRCWGLLFALMLINSPMAKLLGVGVIVPPLAMVAALLIARANRRPVPNPSPTRLAEDLGVILQEALKLQRAA